MWLHKHNYYKFREYYDEKNNKVLSELNKECELENIGNFVDIFTIFTYV